jgi:hypothetical protein
MGLPLTVGQIIAFVFLIILILLGMINPYRLFTFPSFPSFPSASSRNEHYGQEIYAISENVHRYQEAEEACKKMGARLATEAELADAYKKGANWCNLGWVHGIKAYYPMQHVDASGKCGGKGLNGGRMASQLKLGATCYGIKPPEGVNNDILPFDTRSGSWNMPQ